MVKEKLIIKTIDYGIACRVEDTIYINKKLDNYRRLKRAIMSHERNHTEGLTMRDFLMDLDIKELKGLKKEYYKFVIQNPSSWIEFFPVKKYGDVVLFNFPVMLIWLFGGAMLWFVLSGIF